MELKISKTQSLALKFITAICSAATFGWLCFFAGAHRGSGVPVSSAHVSSNQPIFEFDGKTVTEQSLPQESQKTLAESRKKSDSMHFTAEYNYFREADRVARARIVEAYVKSEAVKKQKTEKEVSEEILNVPPATTEQARALFFSSDPAATEKDFHKLEPELRAYISEVTKREAFDTLVGRLESEHRAKVLLTRPTRDAVTIDTEGFPVVGDPKSRTVVVSFVDYFCEGCSQYNMDIAALVRDFDSSAKFVFIPFPYTRPDKSISLARGAICAERMGSFLAFHMHAIAKGELISNMRASGIAEETGLSPHDFMKCYVQGSSVGALLQKAQAEATRAGVLKTPVTFVNGKIFEGPENLASVRAEIEKSQQMALNSH